MFESHSKNSANTCCPRLTLSKCCSSNASIEDEVINKQKVQILLDELKQKLDMQERKILSKYLQGYKYSEIAQKLNVSTKKVDNTITKAKKLVSKYKND